jgi:hypothetical protein
MRIVKTDENDRHLKREMTIIEYGTIYFLY